MVKSENNGNLYNCILGYKKDNKWIKITYLSDLVSNNSSKEIILQKHISESVYIFPNLFLRDIDREITDDSKLTFKLDVEYKLEVNTKNIVVIPNSVKVKKVIDKTDDTQYPA